MKLALAELISGEINDYRPQPFSEPPYVATYMPSRNAIIVRNKDSKVLGEFELTHDNWREQASDIFFELKQLES